MKNTFIVLDDEASMDTFDVHTLGFVNRSDVEKVGGVIFRDTRQVLRQLPVFYYDGDSCISGFEGWGWDVGVPFTLHDDVDLNSGPLITF